ncbi:hypothetical protein [Photorhabdus africana]|uniref:hypothetical protein n=1 Tax=Photorhabdus africana TaxID=3097554 RepID=UPI002B40415E|nr:hypothetical protein [Photorhabdus sp. CRI-LC]
MKNVLAVNFDSYPLLLIPILQYIFATRKTLSLRNCYVGLQTVIFANPFFPDCNNRFTVHFV